MVTENPHYSEPPVHTGVMDDETLDCYLRDLSMCAHIHEVSSKGGATAIADQSPDDFASAIDRLRAGQLRGVQIRYGFDGVLWCDTLMRVENEIHIVRTRQDWDSE